jgi:excisionase family DNA binding protein
MSNSEVTLLSVPQAAERLNVTKSCIRRWIFERRISTIKIGKLVRVPLSEVTRLIDAGTRPARPVW